jgi:branched-chain amino acid transport system substrate-binding protein
MLAHRMPALSVYRENGVHMRNQQLRHFIFVLTYALLISSHANAELLIGRLGSLKNPIAAPTTTGSSEGFDLYLKKVNDAGGVSGQKLKIVFKDDEFNPQMVVSHAKELVYEDRVLALVSLQGTPGSAALTKDGVLQEARIAVVGPFTGDSRVLSAPNIFPLRSSYEDEIAALARQMKAVGQKRIVYFYYNTSQGPLFAPVFEQIVKTAGLEYAGAVGFDINPAEAMQVQLVKEAAGKLVALKPDSVFIFAVGPTFSLAVRALQQQLGNGVTRYTFSINNWEALIKRIGVDDAAGVVFSQAVPYPYSNTRRIVREYQEDLAKIAPQTKVGFAGLEGYMTAKILVEAIRRAGANPTREKVLAALEGLGRYDLGDHIVNYSKNQRRVEPAVDLTIIGRDGKLRK